MASTVAAAFNEFDRRITPGDATWDKVRKRRDIVVGLLQSAFPLGHDISYKSHKIIGSLGRRTASKPIDDIDLLAHLHVDIDLWNRKYRDDSADFLYRVRRSLNSESTVHKVGARGQAVRLFYADGLSVDVAPVERYTTGEYAIPDGSGNWLTTDPGKHESYLNQRNGELVGDLKKLVRFVKQWNRSHSSHLSSFHLEMLVARTFTKLGNNSRTALRLFFEHNKSNFSVQDPAGYSGDLSSYLTPATRIALVFSFSAALDRAESALEAENAGDHKEAIRLWRIILGEQFPTYG